jgi:hypothetical protein
MKKIKVWAATKLPAAIQKLSEGLRTFWQVGINLNKSTFNGRKKENNNNGLDPRVKKNGSNFQQILLGSC